MTRRTQSVLLTVAGAAFVLALGLALSPTLEADYELGAPGPYEVGHTSLLLIDTSREAASAFGGRPVFVSLWYPSNRAATSGAPAAAYPLDPVYGSYGTKGMSYSGEWEALGIDPAFESVAAAPERPFPLVMFSLGWGTRYYGQLFLATRVASHGFVVAIVQHHRDGYIGKDPRDHLAVATLNRPRDISFALTALLTKSSTSGDPLYGVIDPARIVASGHSLGGYAAMTLAAGDDLVCDMVEAAPQDTCVTSPPDPRIRAIVPLDGSNDLLHFYELARVTVPSISLGQEWENVEDWQARQHAAFQGQPNYRVDVNSTLHMSFTNSCVVTELLVARGLVTPRPPAPQCTTTVIPQLEAVRLVSKYMVAFLNTHVKHDPGFQRILTPGWALTRERDIEFFVTERASPNAIDEDWPCCYTYFLNQPGSERAKAYRDPLQVKAVERAEDWR